jgi:hypothetical protein
MAQEAGERLVAACSGQLALTAARAFLDGQVETACCFGAPRLGCRWIRNPRKSTPSSRWQILVLAADRRRPIGANAVAASSGSVSACARVPRTSTIQSSA